MESPVIMPVSGDDMIEQLTNCVDDGCNDITVDMTNIGILFSRPVGEIIAQLKRLQSRNGKLRLIEVNADIFEFLHDINLDKQIEIVRAAIT
jgi:anti-anti-sigma regulatory factor